MTSASPSGAARRRATLIGGIAILLWAALALLTTFTPSLPALQLTAMTFTLAALATLALWLVRGQGVLRHLKLPARAWALGIYGLFGYHALYFLALKLAPPVEASLINYLWPLLIVLFAALLPGEKLRWFHAAGVALGLAGTVVLVAGQGIDFNPAHLPGYLAALACAVTWSSYSVLSRRMAAVPTESIGGFCAATALLAWAGHFAFEQTAWPTALSEWLAVAALGLGPTGLAFFCWDHGVKRGDIKALGAASYATPLFSTLLLLAFAKGEPSWRVALACLLIVGGAILGAGDLRKKS